MVSKSKKWSTSNKNKLGVNYIFKKEVLVVTNLDFGLGLQELVLMVLIGEIISRDILCTKKD